MKKLIFKKTNLNNQVNLLLTKMCLRLYLTFLYIVYIQYNI